MPVDELKYPRLARLEELPPDWPRYPHTRAGYRVGLSAWSATRSMLDARHNEFWMIWTDALPACAFLALLVIAAPTLQPLAAGVYAAVIISRLCSCAYHVYNCCSAGAGRALLLLDRAGIACMALGSPWLFALAYGEPGLRAYVAALCLAFAWSAASGFSPRSLVALAALGNYPALHVAPGAVVLLALGYGGLYLGRIPERLLPEGAADGRIWNSHVLWHIAAACAQLLYVRTTFQ